MSKLSDSSKTLVDGYEPATKNPDLMRGWKRGLTLYCQRRENETGTPAVRFKAAVKMLLTKSGFDVRNV